MNHVRRICDTWSMYFRIGLWHSEWTCEKWGCIWSSTYGVTRIGCISVGWHPLWCYDWSCGTCGYWENSGNTTDLHVSHDLVRILIVCWQWFEYDVLLITVKEVCNDFLKIIWCSLQFCLLLSVLAAMPEELGGLGGSVIYIDTEKKFRSGRYVFFPSKNEFRVQFYMMIVCVFVLNCNHRDN